MIEVGKLEFSTSFNISASFVNSDYEYKFIGNRKFTTLKQNYYPEKVQNITVAKYNLNKYNDSLLDLQLNWAPARGKFR